MPYPTTLPKDFIESILPWKAGPAQCLQCGREWVEAWPLGADQTECPRCKSKDTVREEGKLQ